MNRPPSIPHAEFLNLPEDELKELLVAEFGSRVLRCRERALEEIEELINSADARNREARVSREPFEKAAEFSDEQKEIVRQLMRSATRRFGMSLLSMLAVKSYESRLENRYIPIPTYNGSYYHHRQSYG